MNKELETGPDGEARRVKYEGELPDKGPKKEKLSKDDEHKILDQMADDFGFAKSEVQKAYN